MNINITLLIILGMIVVTLSSSYFMYKSESEAIAAGLQQCKVDYSVIWMKECPQK